MYNIKIDKEKKIFHASASGRVTKEEGEALLRDLKKERK